MNANISNFSPSDKRMVSKTFRRWGLHKLADIVDQHHLLAQLDYLVENLSIPAIEKENLILLHTNLDKGLIDILSDQETRNHLDELLLRPRDYYDTIKELQSSLPLEDYSSDLAYRAENIRSFLLSAHEAILKQKILGASIQKTE